MSVTKIRKSLGLSQTEIAILFGVSVGTVRNWEQGIRSPENSAITLYKLVRMKKKEVFICMVGIACEKKYKNLTEISSLLRLISKVIKDKVLCCELESILFKTNPRGKAKKLSSRLTKI